MKKESINKLACKGYISSFVLMIIFFAFTTAILLCTPISVRAASTDHTEAEAVAWIRAQADNSVSYGECVYLARAYYVWMGYDAPWGNGNSYADADKIMPGWWKDNNPTPGSIYVEQGATNHVSLVYAVDAAGTIYTVDSNIQGSPNAAYFPWNYLRTKDTYSGKPDKWFVHPKFKSGGTPSASFSPWSDSKYTYVYETDAAIGQKINASGGTLTQYGMVLYNSNGTELARASDSTSSWSNSPGTVFFKINAECGYLLAEGTTYQYKFFAVVGGKTFWSNIQSFTTKGTQSVTAVFSAWNNSNYTYVGETDASLGQKITASGGTLTQYGMVLYNSNGTELARASDSTSSWSNNPGTVFFKVNAELRYTLTPGTNYKYRFYAIISGVTKWSDMQSFTTNGTASITVTFSPWSNSNYTYILATDAAIGQQIYVSGGTLSQYGMVLYDSNGTELARAVDSTSSWSNDPGKVYFKINQECGYTLTPGTSYYYRFFIVLSGVTKWSSMQSFKTIGTSPVVKPSISWTESYHYPSKYSALLCVRANSSISASFSEASIKIWDKNGTLVASKTENDSINTLTSLPIWYDVYSEMGKMLVPSSNYTYQFTTKANGYEFKSPVYSFVTESESQNHFGIDVSAHQGNIDWATVSNYIDFAIIRCGYGSDYSSNDDGQWINNVTACEAYGIPYGVYLYSYAENAQEADSEAAHVLRLLAGHKPSLPVYLDLEDDNTVGRLSNDQLLAQTRVFCTKIQSAGYQAGVYASKSWWDNKLKSSDYNKYDKWVAIYSGSYASSMNHCDMWQYSSAGNVPGINTRVDLNYRNENVVLAPKCLHYSIIYKNETSATCDKPGYSGDHYCETCGAYLGKGYTIDALGHDFSNNAQYCRRGCGKENLNYDPPENTDSGSGSVTTSSDMAVLDNVAKSLIENADPAGSVFSILQLKAKKVKKTAITIGWKAVPGATGYVIYAAPCGTKYSKFTDVAGTSFTQSGLKKGKYYKYFVAAHDRNGNILASSKTVHIATSGGKKGNTKSVRLNKKKATLKKGKTVKLKASLKNGKLKVSKHRKVAFETDNPAVATVSGSGKIKAVGKGTCFVYAYAQNGVFAKCKITVK